MAQGDVKADIAVTAAGAFWTIQPPLGEHWLVKRVFHTRHVGVAPDVIPDVGINFSDGLRSTNFGDLSNPENSARLLQGELNIGINNAVYVRLLNNHTDNANIGYSAIQIK